MEEWNLAFAPPLATLVSRTRRTEGEKRSAWKTRGGRKAKNDQREKRTGFSTPRRGSPPPFGAVGIAGLAFRSSGERERIIQRL